MSKTVYYDLGFNWSTSRATPFTEALAEETRRRDLKWFSVSQADARTVRRRVSESRMRVGVFLNTQADGTNLDHPHMLLCRSLKAAGTLVIEDPDDAPVYANRRLQLDYLQRAGLAVPRRLSVEDWKPGKPVLTASQQAKIGPSWYAIPATGMAIKAQLYGTGKLTSSMLTRSGFRARQPILIFTDYHRVIQSDHSRFRLWYLFGHVATCQYTQQLGRYETLAKETDGLDLLPSLTALVHQISQITGLDWFVTEVVVEKKGGRKRVLIVEPANALAQLGPGAKVLSDVPTKIQHLAAERLAEVAWRHARNLPLTEGVTVHLQPQT